MLAGLVSASADGRAGPADTQADATDDPLATYREQFKHGMDRYRAGAVADAIGYWEPIYRELGEARGYRLAYDLGVAYQELGDATHAAERLQAFLAEVEARRTNRVALAAIVEREEQDTRSRMARLVATKGRIHVEASSPPRAARVDSSEPRLAGFVAWVTPGEHKVTFAEGTREVELRVVRVGPGEIVEVTPPQAVSPSSADSVLGASPLPAGEAPERDQSPALLRRETVHPFPWPLIALSGGVAVGAGIATVPLYNTAWSLHDQAQLQQRSGQAADAQGFFSARTLAYGVAAGAIGFAAVTGGLAAWYFLGTTERDVVMAPAFGPERGGASLGMTGRF
ncbi:MAG TPA: hypothetical protein VE987_08790 [Polyangiaceae bacterium]|nr:hypothetical protein [Polyangiaceae bacterium]